MFYRYDRPSSPPLPFRIAATSASNTTSAAHHANRKKAARAVEKPLVTSKRYATSNAQRSWTSSGRTRRKTNKKINATYAATIPFFDVFQ